jgi:hypothetical protein
MIAAGHPNAANKLANNTISYTTFSNLILRAMPQRVNQILPATLCGNQA